MGRVVSKITQIKKRWNAFEDAPRDAGFNAGQSQFYRQDRPSSRFYSDRSFVQSIYVRMAVDLSGVQFFHAMLNDSGVAIKVVEDDLNTCLNLEANIDQSSQLFKQDIAMTMFREGHAAIVPVDCDMEAGPRPANIKQMRVGRVVAWFPQKVTVEVYDDRETNDQGEPVNGGITRQITLPKSMVAIVENPFLDIMNSPNGLLQRLIRKLEILDYVDEAAGSGKLDLIFQLPYSVRGEVLESRAEKRRDALYQQLKDDELGIGYIDVSEKVIQLNRPIENKLLEQIEYLAKQVMSELGITLEIMNGTADQKAINQYYDRQIEPIANAIALEIKRKFLSLTSRTQRHSIEIYRDPLKLIPIDELAEVVDKLLRNAAITANEIRPKIGFMPSSDPRANELANPNMPTKDQPGGSPTEAKPDKEEVLDEQPA